MKGILCFEDFKNYLSSSNWIKYDFFSTLAFLGRNSKFIIRQQME